MDNQNESLNDKMKKAVKAAVKYFADAFNASGNKIKNDSLRIEKISYNNNTDKWEISLGYIAANAAYDPNDSLATLFADDSFRREKVTITVNGATFQVEEYES